MLGFKLGAGELSVCTEVYPREIDEARACRVQKTTNSPIEGSNNKNNMVEII
jgi:hypothetical protein